MSLYGSSAFLNQNAAVYSQVGIMVIDMKDAGRLFLSARIVLTVGSRANLVARPLVVDFLIDVLELFELARKLTIIQNMYMNYRV
jgi:hypothetical protein